MGRLLIGLGVVLLVAGLAVLGLERLGLPLGRLPGDLSFRGKGIKVFAPLGTSVVLSILLSLGSLLLSILLSLLFFGLSRLRR